MCCCSGTCGPFRSRPSGTGAQRAAWGPRNQGTADPMIHLPAWPVPDNCSLGIPLTPHYPFRWEHHGKPNTAIMYARKGDAALLGLVRLTFATGGCIHCEAGCRGLAVHAMSSTDPLLQSLCKHLSLGSSWFPNLMTSTHQHLGLHALARSTGCDGGRAHHGGGHEPRTVPPLGGARRSQAGRGGVPPVHVPLLRFQPLVSTTTHWYDQVRALWQACVHAFLVEVAAMQAVGLMTVFLWLCLMLPPDPPHGPTTHISCSPQLAARACGGGGVWPLVPARLCTVP